MTFRFILLPVLLFLLCACKSVDGSGGEDTDSDADTDTDTDSASDEDTGDTQTDSASDSDTELPAAVENEWVLIEGGVFEMGSERFLSAQPVHTVTVPTFEILKTEVTVNQYRQCVDAGVCDEPDQSDRGCKYSMEGPQYNDNNWLVPQRLNHPVNCINQPQAGIYCQWIGGRLPSEAQWEFAARGGGQDIRFPWGNEDASCDYAVMMTGGEIVGCAGQISFPVCSRPAGNTAQGLCDMAGNCEEWVADLVGCCGYEGAPDDGSAWIQDGSEKTIVRGGDAYDQTGLDVTSRTSPAYEFHSTITTRCVRELN